MQAIAGKSKGKAGQNVTFSPGRASKVEVHDVQGIYYVHNSYTKRNIPCIMSMQIGIRKQQGRGHTSRIKIPCPKCDGYYLRTVYVKGRPEWRRVGLYCDGCRYFEPVEKLVAIEVVQKYPVLEHVVDALKPYMSVVRGLYLHGSRVRGDFRVDSDYDLLLISQDKIDGDLEGRLKEHNVQLQAFTLKGVRKQLELEPSFILTILRDGVAVIGADLKDQLLREKINDIALHVEIVGCIKQVKKLKKAIKKYELHGSFKMSILYSAFIRLRRAYEIKRIYDSKVPPLAEEFKKYYKGDFEHLYGLWRVVRDLIRDEKENENEVVPEGVEQMSKSTLSELVDSVYAYIKDVNEMIVEIWLETHPE